MSNISTFKEALVNRHNKPVGWLKMMYYRLFGKKFCYIDYAGPCGDKSIKTTVRWLDGKMIIVKIEEIKFSDEIKTGTKIEVKGTSGVRVRK